MTTKNNLESFKVKLALTRAGAEHFKKMVDINRTFLPGIPWIGKGFDNDYQQSIFLGEKNSRQLVYFKVNSEVDPLMGKDCINTVKPPNQNIFIARNFGGNWALINSGPFAYPRHSSLAGSSIEDSFLSTFRYLSNIQFSDGIAIEDMKALAATICNYGLFRKEYWNFSIKYDFFDNTKDPEILAPYVSAIVKSELYKNTVAYEMLREEFMAGQVDQWYTEWLF